MKSMMCHGVFVAKVKALAEGRGIASALEYMYDELDELLLAGCFYQCDQILRLVDPRDISMNVSIGYLTITLPWRRNLAERGTLIQHIHQFGLEQLPKERVDVLLKGLE